MAKIEARLEELGIKLHSGATPVANYVSVRRDGDLLYLSGGASVGEDGKPTHYGKVGSDVTLEVGYEAARRAGITLISNIKREVGDLDKVVQIVKVLGFVESADDFFSQPAVMNGCSDLFVEVFGDKGRHARSAIGVNALPSNVTVEIEAIVRVSE